MRQPKNRDDNDRLRMERFLAVNDWKKGEYPGEVWKTFFLGEFTEFVNGFEADSIEIWLQGAGYYVNADSNAGIRTKRLLRVGELWKEYCGWCADEAYVPKYVKQFSRYLADLGFRRRFVGGSRNFDVFVQDVEEEVADFQVQAILLGNEAKLKKVYDERRRMQEIQDALREKMEVCMQWEKDSVWFSGVASGEHEARRLFDDYIIWCGERQQQPLGKKKFYEWLVEQGMVRETVRGILMMEKSK